MTGTIYVMLTEKSSGVYYIFTWGFNALQNDEHFGECIVNDILEK